MNVDNTEVDDIIGNDRGITGVAVDYNGMHVLLIVPQKLWNAIIIPGSSVFKGEPHLNQSLEALDQSQNILSRKYSYQS